MLTDLWKYPAGGENKPRSWKSAGIVCGTRRVGTPLLAGHRVVPGGNSAVFCGPWCRRMLLSLACICEWSVWSRVQPMCAIISPSSSSSSLGYPSNSSLCRHPAADGLLSAGRPHASYWEHLPTFHASGRWTVSAVMTAWCCVHTVHSMLPVIQT